MLECIFKSNKWILKYSNNFVTFNITLLLLHYYLIHTIIIQNDSYSRT